MSTIHIPLCDFYDYTPVEIDWALQPYYEMKSSESKTNWERTRVLIYYQYLYTPSKKNKVSYNQFKNEFLPFSFDALEKPDVMNDETIETIQGILKEKGM